MHALETIRWMNASYGGVVEFRVKVSGAINDAPGRRREVSDEDVQRIADEIASNLESIGLTVRVEHVRYPG